MKSFCEDKDQDPVSMVPKWKAIVIQEYQMAISIAAQNNSSISMMSVAKTFHQKFLNVDNVRYHKKISIVRIIRMSDEFQRVF